MIINKGRLKYASFWDRIMLTSESGEYDLRAECFRIFANLNDKKVSIGSSINTVMIYSDTSSNLTLKYDNNEETIIILEQKGSKLVTTDLGLQIPNILQKHNGSMIIVESDDESISISLDES